MIFAQRHLMSPVRGRFQDDFDCEDPAYTFCCGDLIDEENIYGLLYTTVIRTFRNETSTARHRRQVNGRSLDLNLVRINTKYEILRVNHTFRIDDDLSVLQIDLRGKLKPFRRVSPFGCFHGSDLNRLIAVEEHHLTTRTHPLACDRTILLRGECEAAHPRRIVFYHAAILAASAVASNVPVFGVGHDRETALRAGEASLHGGIGYDTGTPPACSQPVLARLRESYALTFWGFYPICRFPIGGNGCPTHLAIPGN